MQQVHQHIQTTLQDIYRKAVDADASLTALQQEKKGNFQAVFTSDAGFSTQAKRFLPYVQELTDEFEQLKTLSDDEQKQALAGFVGKLELMLRTLAQFKAS